MNEKLQKPFRYCLSCGIVTLVAVDEEFQEFHFHMESDWNKDANWLKEKFIYCFGPFVNVAPPEFPGNWIDTVSEPSPFEFGIMDENAALLLADFKCLEK